MICINTRDLREFLLRPPNLGTRIETPSNLEHFEKGKRQNYLSDVQIGKIIETYQRRPESVERYARRVGMDEIEAKTLT